MFAAGGFSLAGLVRPVSCWKTILGVDRVEGLVSLILDGERVGTNLLGDGDPVEDEDTLLRRSLIALLASLSSAWFSTSLRLRSFTAELRCPTSAVVLSEMILCVGGYLLGTAGGLRPGSS